MTCPLGWHLQHLTEKEAAQAFMMAAGWVAR